MMLKLGRITRFDKIEGAVGDDTVNGRVNKALTCFLRKVNVVPHKLCE